MEEAEDGARKEREAYEKEQEKEKKEGGELREKKTKQKQKKSTIQESERSRRKEKREAEGRGGVPRRERERKILWEIGKRLTLDRIQGKRKIKKKTKDDRKYLTGKGEEREKEEGSWNREGENG